jgi:hypothetical protein
MAPFADNCCCCCEVEAAAAENSIVVGKRNFSAVRASASDRVATIVMSELGRKSSVIDKKESYD